MIDLPGMPWITAMLALWFFLTLLFKNPGIAGIAAALIMSSIIELIGGW